VRKSLRKCKKNWTRRKIVQRSLGTAFRGGRRKRMRKPHLRLAVEHRRVGALATEKKAAVVVVDVAMDAVAVAAKGEVVVVDRKVDLRPRLHRRAK